MVSIEGKHSNRKVYKTIVTYNCSRLGLSMCKRESDSRLLQWCRKSCLIFWPWSRHSINCYTTQRCASYIDGFVEAKSASSSSDEDSGTVNETFCSLVERFRENKVRVRILKERIKFKKSFLHKHKWKGRKMTSQSQNRKKESFGDFRIWFCSIRNSEFLINLLESREISTCWGRSRCFLGIGLTAKNLIEMHEE